MDLDLGYAKDGREYGFTSETMKKYEASRVPIEEENLREDMQEKLKVLDEIFVTLSQKFKAHFNISVRTDGFSHIQIHSEPTFASKGEKASEIIEKALKM